MDLPVFEGFECPLSLDPIARLPSDDDNHLTVVFSPAPDNHSFNDCSGTFPPLLPLFEHPLTFPAPGSTPFERCGPVRKDRNKTSAAKWRQKRKEYCDNLERQAEEQQQRLVDLERENLFLRSKMTYIHMFLAAQNITFPV